MIPRPIRVNPIPSAGVIPLSLRSIFQFNIAFQYSAFKGFRLVILYRLKPANIAPKIRIIPASINRRSLKIKSDGLHLKDGDTLRKIDR